MPADRIIYFNLSVDCEATQPAVNDAALGERAMHGIVDILEAEDWRGSFFVVPTDIEAHGPLYKQFHAAGHEIGLHIHPSAQGYSEFLGIYGAQMQRKIIGEAADRFAQVMGFRPRLFCPGYASANDATYSVLTELGFTHGICSMPGRVLPECAAVWAGAPEFMHYANAHNRLLSGSLDFVEIPRTADLQSMMWGGKTPQDLRVELVDAKNHSYTIKKSVAKQIEQDLPVKIVLAFTHNLFEYSDKNNFRRETLDGIISHFKNIVTEAGFEARGSTFADAVALYRERVEKVETTLELDRSGYLEQEKI